MKQHLKTCNFCGETFYSKRIDAKTCSNSCRVYLYELKNGTFNTDKYLKYTENNVNKSKLSVIETLDNDNEKLKQFFLKHRKEISDFAIELDLFTEDEFAEVAIIATQATDILFELRDENKIAAEYFPKINEIEYEYILKHEEE